VIFVIINITEKFRKDINMKRISLILAVIFLALSLCACTPPSTETPVPSPTGGSGTEDKFDLETVYMKPGDTYRIYMYNLENEETPEEYYVRGLLRDQLDLADAQYIQKTYGVTIKYTPWKGSWFTEYCGAAASGEPLAEMLYTVGPHTLGQLYMWDGMAGSAMLPISDYDYVYKFDDREYWDVDAQNAVCYYGGKLYYVIPRLIGDNMVNLHQYTFYNKKYLSAAGYSPESLVKTAKEGNWTWDYFRQVAMAVNDPDKQVYALLTGQENSLVYNLMFSNGGDYVKKETVNGLEVDRFSAHQNESLEAWSFYLDLEKNNLVMPKSMGGEDIWFRNGKAAMMLTHLNRSDTYSNYPELEFGILPIPKAPGAESYVSGLNWFMPYGIFKNIKNPEGVVQFMSLYFRPAYAMSSEENLMLLESELSVRLQDEDSVQFAIDALDYTYPSNMLIYQNTCAEYMWYASESFVKGETTPDVYFASVADAVNAKIDIYNGLADY